MDSVGRYHDRGHRHLFKGSILVSTLSDFDQVRFPSRADAAQFAQSLLDAGHIQSITGSRQFDDSFHLYRWTDDSVVKDAKKLISTTASHIPKNKLIELLQHQQKSEAEPNCHDIHRGGHRRFFHFDNIAEELELERQRAASPCFSTTNSDSGTRSTFRPYVRSSPFSTSAGSLFTSSLLYARDHTREGDGRVNGQSPITPWNIQHQQRQLRQLAASPVLPVSSREYNRTMSNRSFTVTPPLSPVVVQPEMVKSPIPIPENPSSIVQSAASNTEKENDVIATCKYDGVEMEALDLENLDFTLLRPDTQTLALESMANMEESLANLEEQSHGYSDNEKQLLDQLKVMQKDHQSMIENYESKINDLMNTISELKDVAEVLKSKKGKQKKDETDSNDNTNMESSQSDVVPVTPPAPPPPIQPTGGVGVPPPPPPPPPPLPLGAPTLHKLTTPMVIQPSKPTIKPRVKMRPLFWNRIIISNHKNNESFWQDATEPNFNVDQFEKLFGRSKEIGPSDKKSLHDALGNTKSKIQAAKLLDDNRSRAVGIKMRSLHCQLQDIKAAVYRLDFSKVDIESLQSLAEIKATEEELGKIQHHVKENPHIPLDQPEDFLWELSKMSYFPERIKCLALKKRFNETLFNIDQQLISIQNACNVIKTSEPIRAVLELVLAFGNYMNGGTQRGQADGFDLNILAKLKDVKAMDNSMTLLNYIVQVACKDHEEDAGKHEARCPLPDPSAISPASSVSFQDLDKEIQLLRKELNILSRKAEEIYMNSDPSCQQPFKEQMDDFFESAEHMVATQQKKIEGTRERFRELVSYMAFEVNEEQVSCEAFFSLWVTFLEDYRKSWKTEQRRMARLMFEKVEEKRKERMRTVKRRRRSLAVMDESTPNNSDVMSGTNLKQKFTALRRRSEHFHSNHLIRSQSVSNMTEIENDQLSGASKVETKRNTKSYSEYPTTKSSPHVPLKPSEILKRRFSAAGVRSHDTESVEDFVFNHIQDDRLVSGQGAAATPDNEASSNLMSSFQLSATKTETKPYITVNNPVTNLPDRVTLRRDLVKISGQSRDSLHPMHEKIRRRRSRQSFDEISKIELEYTSKENAGYRDDFQITSKDSATAARTKGSGLDNQRQPTSPSRPGPMKIDYSTDYVPHHRIDSSEQMQLFANSASHRMLQHGSTILKSSENPSQVVHVGQPYHASSPQLATPSYSTHDVNIENGGVSQEHALSNPAQSAQRVRQHRRSLPSVPRDVMSGPSEAEYSEALRRMARTRVHHSNASSLC